MVIAVDFDGTCTAHDFPRVGKDIGAVPVLKRLVENGHKLILYTMRSDIDDVDVSHDPSLHGTPGNYLTDAVNWFRDNGIKLHAVQKNPTQHLWTTSPKCYAEMYIDDAALGCPLIIDRSKSERPFVDWVLIELMLESRGLI